MKRKRLTEQEKEDNLDTKARRLAIQVEEWKERRGWLPVQPPDNKPTKEQTMTPTDPVKEQLEQDLKKAYWNEENSKKSTTERRRDDTVALVVLGQLLMRLQEDPTKDALEKSFHLVYVISSVYFLGREVGERDGYRKSIKIVNDCKEPKRINELLRMRMRTQDHLIRSTFDRARADAEGKNQIIGYESSRNLPSCPRG